MASSDMKNQDGLLRISWHDSAWIPILNGTNVLDYFAEKTNPFYDRTCNNESIKMQRLSNDQLTNMTGSEYILLHVQEPILYVIRKQHRHSPQQVTPVADYYIIAGVVYQAPDLGAVVNSRLLNTVHHLQLAFDECLSYSRYNPSKGYSWEFKEKQDPEEKTGKKEKKEEPSSIFQRQRVDMLLMELTKKFPPKIEVHHSKHHHQQQLQAQAQAQAALASQQPATAAAPGDATTTKPGTEKAATEKSATTTTAPSATAADPPSQQNPQPDVKPDTSQIPPLNPPAQQQQQQQQPDKTEKSEPAQVQQPSSPQQMKPPPEKKPKLAEKN